jgi:hypothetical protein
MKRGQRLDLAGAERLQHRRQRGRQHGPCLRGGVPPQRSQCRAPGRAIGGVTFVSRAPGRGERGRFAQQQGAARFGRPCCR